MAKYALAIGAFYGLLAVVLGAFGSHALGDTLSERMLSIWRTAEQYQFYHALALIALGLLIRQGIGGALTTAAVVSLALGVFIFSGSLYLLATTGVRWLGAITPIGGTVLIIGWVLFLLTALIRL